MRVRATTLGCFCVVLLAVASCGGGGDSDSSASTTAPPTTAPAGSGAVGLAGKTFISTGVKGHKLVRGTRINLTFSDNDLSVQAGCNTLGGAYRLEGDRLIVDQLGGTEMGCDTPRHDQDQWLADFFTSQPTAEIAQDTITLKAAGSALTLRDREVAQPDTPLVGTTWIVDTIIHSADASNVPDGMSATIAFPSETRIEVYDGCNRTSGAVKMGADAITIVDLPAPVRANCAPGSALDYDTVLTGRVVVQIDGKRLTLSGPDGSGYGLHAE
jgi:heat shock protein HslJ